MKTNPTEAEAGVLAEPKAHDPVCHCGMTLSQHSELTAFHGCFKELISGSPEATQSSFGKLWDWFALNHDMHLTDTELHDIIDAVKASALPEAQKASEESFAPFFEHL